ncbi:malate dehydrogenase 3, cytoplasmic-like isoform X1 [Cephus cinctus]|uniref:Malate dehydrogenase 3, cytoplasmic-like isoform X1 n=1 Tax=Cephus cinctus TaxID=211228 RepID=A0AAJ7VZK1_CEPCN|nr:malate dehydrogenase 3, cytoplasmic-like isoform X1 [Cephus cinctus]
MEMLLILEVPVNFGNLYMNITAYEVENMIASSKIKQKRHCVTIIGAGRSLCPDLVAQLVLIKELWLHCGVIIKLYDDPGHFFKLKEIVKDTSAIGGGLCATTIAQSMSKALEDSDIVLVLDHLIREDNESSENWLNRNRMVTIKFADEINKEASSDLKIIFCSTGPTCFCAAVLLEAVPKLKKTNIVAVSAHYGLEILHSLTDPLDLPLREFYCPPVWGFLGVNQYVDIWHIIQQHEVYKPNNRAFKFSTDSSLPLGTKHTEYRWSFYMAHNANPYEILAARKAKASYLVGRTEDYQKCKAICDLLQLWYDRENDTGDDIISLGICSDGTFDIPKNIFFSQPVYLKTLQDKSRIWVPCEDFPMPNHPSWMFRGLIATAKTISQRMIYSKESTTL